MTGWHPFTPAARAAVIEAGVEILEHPASRCEDCPRLAQLKVPLLAGVITYLCVPCALAHFISNIDWVRYELAQARALADRLPLRGEQIVSAPDAGSSTTQEGDDPGACSAPGAVSMPAPG